MEQRQRFLLFLLALAVAVPVIIKSRPGVSERAPAAFHVLSFSRCRVAVSGDVRHPGVYSGSVNLMAETVILMAEPISPFSLLVPTESAAIPLRDGELLQVSIDGGGTARVTRRTMSARQRLVLGIPFDLNSVTANDLDQMPGIGPVMAGAIVKWRQNNGGSMAVADLLKVEGIGEKKFFTLKKYFQPAEI